MKQIIVEIITALIKAVVPFAIEKVAKAIRSRKRKPLRKCKKNHLFVKE